MINTMIFDLDGTLVQTEKLKAQSYARAAVQLCPNTITEEEVIEAFKDVIGRSRREVALALMERFHLEEAAKARMREYGVSAPWQAFVRIRLEIYEAMIQDPEVLKRNPWPHTLALLRQARENCQNVALATMSDRDRTRQILNVLGLDGVFDFVATREDVESGKPDPEIYLLVARELGVSPRECLVIEDSPSGVQAALHAGMAVIAVATPFSRDRLRKMKELDPRWLVEEPTALPRVVQQRLKEAQR